MLGPPSASAQYAARRSTCWGWKPWLNAWPTTWSAITRRCQAAARRRRPSMPPAASKTVRMLHDDKRPAPRQDYGHGEFDRITTVFTRQPPKADPGAVPRAFELAQSWEGVHAVIRLAPTRVVGYSSWRRNAHEDGVIPAASFALCSVAGFPYAGDFADRGWEAKLGGSGAQNARWQT